ncbi:MAG: hypothetical protein ACOY4D_00175 [Pseudomonadota bacterium]
MNPGIKNKLFDAMMTVLAIGVGVATNVALEYWMGVDLHFFSGMDSFTYEWAFTLFIIPFIAGFPVALIYGFGGKLLALFVPLIVQGYKYLLVVYGVAPVPEGSIVLPFIYWVLVVVVAMEFAGGGGWVGEILVKKTYGRTPKHLLYKKAEDGVRVGGDSSGGGGEG